LELKGAEVVMSDRAGKPFATAHHFRKGQALFFESAVTLGYFKRHNPVVQQWIIEPAIKAKADALVRMGKGADKICFRGLAHPSGPVAILSNWGDTETVVVSFGGDYDVAEVLTGKAVQVEHESASRSRETSRS
jgi:hypothetical protein